MLALLLLLTPPQLLLRVPPPLLGLLLLIMLLVLLFRLLLLLLLLLLLMLLPLLLVLLRTPLLLLLLLVLITLLQFPRPMLLPLLLLLLRPRNRHQPLLTLATPSDAARCSSYLSRARARRKNVECGRKLPTVDYTIIVRVYTVKYPSRFLHQGGCRKRPPVRKFLATNDPISVGVDTVE